MQMTQPFGARYGQYLCASLLVGASSILTYANLCAGFSPEINFGNGVVHDSGVLLSAPGFDYLI